MLACRSMLEAGRLSLILPLLGPLAHNQVVAQDAGQRQAEQVIVQAVEHGYAMLAANTTGSLERVPALDRRVLRVGASGPPRRGTDHEEALLEGVSQALGAPIIDLDDVLQCQDNPRVCSLQGATVVYSVGEPEIDGNQARIAVEFTYKVTAGGGLVLRTGWIFVMERRAGEWLVVRTELTWSSWVGL